MPVSNAKLEAMAPNSVEKRETTWKQGQCQMCLAKVPTKNQKTLTNDLDKGTVRVTKAVEGKSHYCDDCADRRKTMKTNWLARRDGEAKPKSSKRGKAKSAKKAKGKKAGRPAAKKAAAKPKAKKAGKPKAAKKAGKAKATADPF